MKVITKNRRARFDYDIERSLIAGIVLSGAETKSIRNSLASLKGSFVQLKDGEVRVFNMHVSPYPHAQQPTSYEPIQPRKLLLNRRELHILREAKLDGRSIVPLALLSGRFIKLEIGIGRGKKKYDKRHAIKKRDIERSVKVS